MTDWRTSVWTTLSSNVTGGDAFFSGCSQSTLPYPHKGAPLAFAAQPDVTVKLYLTPPALGPSLHSWCVFQVGTLEYMAPEVLLQRAGGAPADVYALAVTINEAATGTPPFSDCTRDNPHCQTVLNFNYGRWRTLPTQPPWNCRACEQGSTVPRLYVHPVLCTHFVIFQHAWLVTRGSSSSNKYGEWPDI